jgi:predicted DNA-binding protein with PD1-like motif
MQKLILILTLLAVSGMAAGQETRIETTTPANAAEDSRPNSDAVPDAYAISTEFERILVVRLKHQSDLLAGLEGAVKKEKVRNGVILSGIGSVRGYHFHMVSNRDFPSQNVFVKNPTAPADLVSMNGYVINSRIHAHATFSNPDKAFGGHLEPGTEVFTFAIITIGVLNEKTDLSRVDDKAYR